MTQAPHAALLPWVRAQLPGAGAGSLELIAGDASFRRYFRYGAGSRRWIVCEAPPALEKNEEFLHIRALLAAAGVRVPEVVAADLEHGFLLLEDLGDRLLLAALNADTADTLYRPALAMLLKLAAARDTAPALAADLPVYSAELLGQEMDLFPQWFVQGLLNRSWSAPDAACFQALRARLLASALEQPRVLVHRDFHSRNLMCLADGSLAAIDFQDAVLGPLTYDLVSLLKDCYLRWPERDVRRWALQFLNRLRQQAPELDVDDLQFLRWFDLMGLQRHIKVLGIFARLHLRDGKAAYLADLPRVVTYVQLALESYRDEPALVDFAAWFAAEVTPVLPRQPWWVAA